MPREGLSPGFVAHRKNENKRPLTFKLQFPTESGKEAVNAIDHL